jgi:Holliday junction resolvase
MNDEEDYFIEDLAKNLEKTKKVNSARIGKHGERELCKVLKTRFEGKSFFRVVGSGNRYSQVNLTEHAKMCLVGDLVCDPTFKFSVEVKWGYKEVDLFNILDGNKKLDSFLEQAEKAAKMQNKQPILCWKKPHKYWLCFVKKDILPTDITYFIQYREWIGLTLDTLLAKDDSFFFVN